MLKKQEHCGSLILCHENNNQPLFSGSNTTLIHSPRCRIRDSLTSNSTWIFNIDPSFTYRTPIFENDTLILFIYTISASVISRMVRGVGGGGGGGGKGVNFNTDQIVSWRLFSFAGRIKINKVTSLGFAQIERVSYFLFKEVYASFWCS